MDMRSYHDAHKRLQQLSRSMESHNQQHIDSARLQGGIIIHNISVFSTYKDMKTLHMILVCLSVAFHGRAGLPNQLALSVCPAHVVCRHDYKSLAAGDINPVYPQRLNSYLLLT